MDWPTAAVVMSVLGTIAVAFIQFAPQKVRVETHDGERCATKDDVKEILREITALHVFNKETATYTHTRFHDVINAINPISNKLTLLIDRNPRLPGRDSHDNL